MNKRSIFFAMVILIGSTILAACGGGGSATPTPMAATSPAPVNPPTSTPQIALPVAPSAVSRSIHLDPAITEDADSLAVSGLVYDGLTRLDASGNPQPALASSWTVSDDQLDYVVTLRQGAAFSNGDAFTADVVLANFNRWFDRADALHGSPAYPGWTKFFLGFKGDVDSQGVAVSPFDGIEKVDEHTVLIHLNRPEPKLLENLAQPYFAMLDPVVLASQGEATGTTAQSVIGTGAYRVSSWTDAGLVLAPNASYWGSVPAGNVTIAWK